MFNVCTDVGERNDMVNIRQDVARPLRFMLAEWEADVNAEAEAGGYRR